MGVADLDVVLQGPDVALAGEHAHGLLEGAHAREDQALGAGYVGRRLHLHTGQAPEAVTSTACSR